MVSLRRPVVLSYHGVGAADDETDPRRLVTAPGHLDAHIRLLQRLGYRFVRAESLLETWPPRPATAVLTFDDGWADGLDVVLPLLARRDVPATFFVCPGWWGRHHPRVPGPGGRLLTREETATLAEAGMEVASHSIEHRDLRQLSDEELTRDLRSSKEEVEAVTGTRCVTFAYPFGLFGPREQAAVLAAGYALAFAWRPGPWERSAVPRLPAPPRHGAQRLALKLLGIRRPIRLS